MNDPEIIYLQREEDETFGRTWCEDKIYDDDVEYVRADLIWPAIENGTIDLLLN